MFFCNISKSINHYCELEITSKWTQSKTYVPPVNKLRRVKKIITNIFWYEQILIANKIYLKVKVIRIYTI